MKVRVEVDCTPEEARTFLGLPEIKPMQDALMAQMQERLSANMGAMDPEALWKTWFPVSLQNMEHIQRMFWSHLASATGRGSAPESK